VCGCPQIEYRLSAPQTVQKKEKEKRSFAGKISKLPKEKTLVYKAARWRITMAAR